MKDLARYSILALVILAATSACVENGGDSNESVTATKSEKVIESSPVCVAVEALDMSLDKLGDSDSIDEYRANYEVVKQDFETLRNADDGRYSAETQAFESALEEFEASMASFGDEGLISGLIGLASDAAKLVEAGDTLDDAIDCPGA